MAVRNFGGVYILLENAEIHSILKHLFGALNQKRHHLIDLAHFRNILIATGS